MNTKTVLVSGAGTAGPALAYWLRRYGFVPTVVEVSPALRPGGHAVDIRGAARDVLDRMELLEVVRRAVVPERGLALVNDRGRRTASLAAGLYDGEGIVAEIEIMRGELSRILYDATRDDVEYLFRDRIVELADGEDGVDVRFAGGSRRRFDIVVGADGVHSGVRALAFGPEDRFVHHLGAYTAYFTVPDPGDLDGWFLMHNARGGLVSTLRPERGGSAKASLTFTSTQLDYDRRDLTEQQRILAERMRGAGWRVAELLLALPAADDFYFDAVCQVRVERWWRGNVALVGDAAYCGSPLTGLGTSMSIVGAYVLAGELAGSPDDPEAAFAHYQDRLAEFVAAGMTLPPGGVRSVAPQSRMMIALRAQSMRMMAHWPMRTILARQAAKSGGITLPDYPVPYPDTHTRG